MFWGEISKVSKLFFFGSFNIYFEWMNEDFTRVEIADKSGRLCWFVTIFVPHNRK